MNKKNFAIAVAAALVATKAFALTENASSGIIPGGFLVGPPPSGGQASTGGNLNLPVAKFSGAGNLTGVSYTLTVWSYATYDVVNKNVDPTAHFVTWALDATANSLTLPSGGAPLLFGAGPYNLPLGSLAPAAVSTGTTPSQIFNLGPSADTLAAYQGAGNAVFVFSPSAISSVLGSPGQTSPLVFVAAKVDVVYTYNNDVPEASTYAAGAVVLAGAGFMARRRMLAAK